MSTTNNGHLVSYIRVSSFEQNPDRQLEALAQFKLDKTFIDKASGKDTARSQLQAALAHLREGDTFIIPSIDRLARNLDDLRSIVQGLTDRGVTVQFVKESLVFGKADSPMSKLMLSMMGAFAEFERSLIRERQMEGIALAKARGAFKGRKPSLNSAQISELIAKDKANNSKNRAALALSYGISRGTLYNILSANNEN
jgi:DNA invertase Pin-like site-specific DNA recombinase